jgi:putative aldouronate transport system permease protein
MLVPILAYYIVFHYAPILGAVIAFKKFSPRLGIFGSPWAGFRYFQDFFNSMYFTRVLRNTVLISTYEIIFGFPMPIILALLINEVKNRAFKRTIQTISYLPYFISVVVVCGLIKDYFASDGVINNLMSGLGMQPVNFLNQSEWFRPILVGSNIWQHFGWNSIIYLSALTAIDPQTYEAALMDGANRWKQTLYITIPGILPVAVTLLILRIGNIMSVGFEKIILLYNPMTYETGEVISTFVYKKGLLEMNYSYSAAVGLINAAVNCMLLVLANRMSRRINNTTIW